MNSADARNLAFVAVIAVAPLVVVLLFAILRGYTIDLHMGRGRRRRHDDDTGDDE